MKKALFVCGGWDGHTPKESTELLAGWLAKQRFEVEVSDSLEAFGNADKLGKMHLIVPVWTMGQLTAEQEQALCDAVAGGVGIAGWHGTMGDAFRNNTNYQFMTGGQFVAHPGNIQPAYGIHIVDREHPITRGLKDFTIPNSEQYYLHVDPSNHVLATTTFPSGVVMPAVWTRPWGQGRVAYASFGHTYKDFDVPQAREIVQRSLLWAAR
jgi:type 1 glutamine amidotransferase